VCALPNVQICGDGNYVMTAIGGVTNFQKLEALLGLEGDPDFAEPHAVINKSDGPRAEKIVKAMTDYCMARTAEQVNDDLNALKLPCSTIMTYEMMKNNSHYQARGTFTTWHDDNKDKDLMGVNCIPFFKNNPSQIFRGGPVYGADNEDILEELGFNSDEIADMYSKEVIKK
ncbi:MAG: CoA transferase, partial [Oscillospiraceae bacterium]|nr:CoA transferase [Oscillospiraceae bacterium]